MDPLPTPGVPEPKPAGGSNNDQEGADRGEVSQRHSRRHSDIEVAAGGGLCRESNGGDGEKVGRVYRSLSAPPILRRGPDSM